MLSINKYPILIIIATLKVKTKEIMIKNVFYVSNNQFTTDLHPLRALIHNLIWFGSRTTKEETSSRYVSTDESDESGESKIYLNNSKIICN
jgi:hypothetical protein